MCRVFNMQHKMKFYTGTVEYRETIAEHFTFLLGGDL